MHQDGGDGAQGFICQDLCRWRHLYSLWFEWFENAEKRDEYLRRKLDANVQ